jgi:hypothetical protein
MASPAREVHGLPQQPVFVRSNFAISADKWSSIMGQKSAFSLSGGTLYISRCEGLRGVKGVCWAIALEGFGALFIFGLWRLLH